MGHPVFFSEGVADAKMSGVVHLARRNQMIVDQHHLVRIPEFRKPHFLKFFRHKGDENIMDHHPVHIRRYDLPGRYVPADISPQNFFNDCFSHQSLLLQTVPFPHGRNQSAGFQDI